VSLQCLSPNSLWHATQPITFGPISLSTRMTVVRLQDGSLWVHSPITPTPELINDLAAIGRVRWVVAPNRSHHLFFLPFLAAHPSAEGFIAPGLAAKRPDLKDYPALSTSAPWCGELTAFVIQGLPVLNETVWFHPATGTLIVTDLLFCFSTQNKGFTKLVAKLLGVYGSLGMSRTMKLLVKDKPAFRQSVAALLALPVTRIILAHDQIISDQCPTKLASAFAWLADA
jgi:Domain of unknown function (DUF4336)